MLDMRFEKWDFRVVLSKKYYVDMQTKIGVLVKLHFYN